MEFENLLKLIKAVSDSELTEFRYETDDVEIKMGKGQKSSGTVVVQSAVPQTVVPGLSENVAAQPVQVTAPVQTGPAKAAEGTSEVSGKYVTSPLVGTFYTAPAEDADNFVEVGDKVKKGQVLAIIEAMKLMNEIESEFDGEIAEVLVGNGEAVEYGQPLFRIV